MAERKKNLLSSFLLMSLLFLVGCCLVGCGGGDDSEDSDAGGGGIEPDRNACDVLGLNARVVNGTECSGTSPIVKLRIEVGGTVAFCTGTMIAPNRVLTASHCVYDENFLTVFPASSVTISTGNSNEPIAGARRIIGNSQARGDLVNIAQQAQARGDDPSSDAFDLTEYIKEFGFADVAVIELDRNLSLPTLQVRVSGFPDLGEIVSIFGYGTRNADVLVPTDVLVSGEMQVSDLGIKNIFALYDGTGSDTCSGDSGGPLLAPEGDGSYSIVGTVLGGSQKCEPGDIAIFTATSGSGIPQFIRDNAPNATFR